VGIYIYITAFYLVISLNNNFIIDYCYRLATV